MTMNILTNTAAVRVTRLDKNRTNPPLPRIDDALSQPSAHSLSKNKPIPILFCELVNKLGRWFSISDAVLALYDHSTGRLKIASWWDLCCFKEGVHLNLPTEDSLFHEAIGSRSLLHIQVNGDFPGNYIEQQLMTSKATAALAVYPLVYNGVINSVISLSSPVPYAFEMLEEGYFSTVLKRLASVIADCSPREFWEPTFAATGQSVNLADGRYDSMSESENTAHRVGTGPKSRPDYGVGTESIPAAIKEGIRKSELLVMRTIETSHV